VETCDPVRNETVYRVDACHGNNSKARPENVLGQKAEFLKFLFFQKQGLEIDLKASCNFSILVIVVYKNSTDRLYKIRPILEKLATSLHQFIHQNKNYLWMRASLLGEAGCVFEFIILGK
jgi:hypothetical protein